MMSETLVTYETTDTTLPWVDYSTLAAVNMCPRWGIVHAYHGKRLVSGVERAMPLEAGRAMHEVFACVRMFDLLTHLHNKGDDTAVHEVCLYGADLYKRDAEPDRWDQALTKFWSTEDAETRCIQMALVLLETGGFYDSPSDKKRTQSNLEVAAINYVQKYPLGRYIPLYNYGRIRVGVEIPFDITLRLPDERLIRYIGRIDAACRDTQRISDPRPEVHENKTGSRIDTVWSASFDTSHQLTGYCVALSTILKDDIKHCTVWGTQIPVPKSSQYGDGQSRYPATRDASSLADWAAWVQHTVNLMAPYLDEPWLAPMYTHSCNRYFRACSFIPFCTETKSMREHIFHNEMTTQRWNPLEGEAAVLASD